MTHLFPVQCVLGPEVIMATVNRGCVKSLERLAELRCPMPVRVLHTRRSVCIIMESDQRRSPRPLVRAQADGEAFMCAAQLGDYAMMRCLVRLGHHAWPSCPLERMSMIRRCMSCPHSRVQILRLILEAGCPVSKSMLSDTFWTDEERDLLAGQKMTVGDDDARCR